MYSIKKDKKARNQRVWHRSYEFERVCWWLWVGGAIGFEGRAKEFFILSLNVDDIFKVKDFGDLWKVVKKV